MGFETPHFWNVNVPLSSHSDTCPAFLEYALVNDKDRQILSTPDEKYTRQSWEEVQVIVRTGHLESFQRVPSELRRYREYCALVIQKYGSIIAFVMRERLQWDNLTEQVGRLDNEENYKILYNDWPYGIDRRIVHLVVWTKVNLSPATPTTDSHADDLTSETRIELQTFVDRIFVPACGRSNVLWFKNGSHLKSIHAVEHFHVMLLDPPSDFVQTVTNHDVPQSEVA